MPRASILSADKDDMWRDRQKKVFTNWINHRLKPRIADGKVTELEDVNVDLKNGMALYHLLEELSGQSLKSLGKLSKGKMKIQCIANLNIDFKYLNDTVKTVGIGPQDVYDGNQVCGRVSMCLLD